MSRSRAGKIRRKRIREGFLDPSVSRLNWNGVNPVTRKTPSRLEKCLKTARKHKGRHDHDGLYFMLFRDTSIIYDRKF